MCRIRLPERFPLPFLFPPLFGDLSLLGLSLQFPGIGHDIQEPVQMLGVEAIHVRCGQTAGLVALPQRCRLVQGCRRALPARGG
jgi:hypothetical protein